MEHSRILAIGLLMITPVLAGCLDAASDGASAASADGAAIGIDGGPIAIEPGWSEAALQGGQGHDHRDTAQHKDLSTSNFEVIGYNPLYTDYYGRTAGGYFCGDVREKDGRALSVVHSWVSDVAMIISDVTDPTNPQKIGELAMANTHVYDLTMTPDQRYVLLATSQSGIGPDDPGGMQAPFATFTDACTAQVLELDGPEAGLPFSSGLVMVDISNPRIPEIVDFISFPVTGGHSIQVADMDGRYIGLATVGLPAYYVFLEILPNTPNGGKMVPLNYYQYRGADEGATPPTPGTNNHDAYIAKHPVTGQWLAYLAYGSSGVVILDIEDPLNPAFVARWADWGVVGAAAPSNPFVHEVLPMSEVWEDGRHYTFFGEECGGARPNTPTCLIFILDTTDPADPTFVGAWTLPHEVEWSGGLQYSFHYIAVSGRTLFVTNYHGGLWAIDVSTPQARHDMPAIGVFMPDYVSPKPIGGQVAFDYTPVVLDLNVLSDGTLVVYDGTSGLYTVTFDASRPAPSPPAWPLGYNQ